MIELQKEWDIEDAEEELAQIAEDLAKTEVQRIRMEGLKAGGIYSAAGLYRLHCLMVRFTFCSTQSNNGNIESLPDILSNDG